MEAQAAAPASLDGMKRRVVISELISQWAKSVTVEGKSGTRLLQPSLAGVLRAGGFVADEEDSRQVLRAGMPVWRSKESGQVEPTTNRRRIDIVVYDDSRLVALVETESDLNDLRSSGVTRRSGHYDVASIARAESGTYFDSYKSLERMAAAAYYHHVQATSGEYPSSDAGVRSLASLRSSEPAIHNPSGLALILVSGTCRAGDRGILAPRLASLGAELVCVSERG